MEYILENLDFPNFLVRFGLRYGDFDNTYISEFYFIVDAEGDAFGVFEEMGAYSLFSIVKGVLRSFRDVFGFTPEFFHLFHLLYLNNDEKKCFPVFYSEDIGDFRIIKFSGYKDFYIVWDGKDFYKNINF